MAGNQPEERARIPLTLQDGHAVAFLHWCIDPDDLARLGIAGRA